MISIDAARKAWNQRQKVFRETLNRGENYPQAVEMFFEQHGVVHAGEISDHRFFSFEDEVFAELSEEVARRIPKNKEHSIAWCIWHIARIEDITMNILVADQDQLFRRQDWRSRMNIEFLHTGNGMGESQPDRSLH